MSTDRRTRICFWLCGLGVCVLGVVLFGGTLSAPFTSDDIIVTEENSLAGDAANIPRYFVNDFDWIAPKDSAIKDSRPSQYGLYRPLLATSYNIDYALHGPAPFGWRLGNLLLHLTASLLVLALAYQILGSLLGAFVAAMLFVAHPMHVAALASLLAGRAELLAAVFVLASWLVFIKGNTLKSARRWAVDCASAVLFLLGLFSKENAGMLPAILVLYGLVAAKLPVKKLFIRIIPHIGVLLGYTILRLAVVGRVAPNSWAQMFGQLSGPMIFLVIMAIMTLYLRLVLVPYPLSHPDCYSNLPGKVPPWAGIIAALFVAGLIFFCVWRIVRDRNRTETPLWAFCVLLFYLCLVPVSHVIPFRVLMADRFLYLPSVAFCLFGGWLLMKAYRTRSWLAAAAGAPLLACFIAGVVAGNAIWTNLDRLYQQLIGCRPDSPDPYNNIGTDRLRANRPAEAIPYFRMAIRVSPETPDPHYNLGLAYQRLGQDAKAEKAYRRTLAIDQKHGMAANNLGILIEKHGDHMQARKYFEMAARLDPSHPAPLVNLGNICQKNHEYSKAEKYFLRALKIDPRLDEARFNLARLFEQTGRPGRAERLYRQILANEPNHAMALNNLANLYKSRHEIGKSLEYYRAALKADPGCAAAHFNLANLFLSRGDYRAAIEHYSRSLEIRPNDVGSLIGLSYARLKNGQIDVAARLAERTAKLAPADPRLQRLLADIKKYSGGTGNGSP